MNSFFFKILDLFNEQKIKLMNLLTFIFLRWSIERLPKVQLAILRVAIAEMMIYPKTSVGIIISDI